MKTENGAEIKALVARLEKLHKEAQEIRALLEEYIEDGELISSPLWSIEGSCKEVVGDLMLRAYRTGNMTFVPAAEEVPFG